MTAATARAEAQIRELIQHTLLESTSPLVRLPAAHGVLVTDPRLARKLLEGEAREARRERSWRGVGEVLGGE